MKKVGYSICSLTSSKQWFYMFLTRRGVYFHPKEIPLQSKCPNKRFTKKVMFLAAVARPQFHHHKHAWFDGLIGIWEFAEEKVAQRTSINCPAGVEL